MELKLVESSRFTVWIIGTSLFIILIRWADKAYKKANSGTKWKKPFMGASMAAGIVVEKVAVEAK